MQTFLPYPDFKRSLQCLDNKRLGKQRVEAMQILQTLVADSKGWVNHPAVKMWRGYEAALALYGIIACNVWIDKGFKDNCKNKILLICAKHNISPYAVEYPRWFGGPIHRSHQSNLKRKDPIFYSDFDVPTNIEYVWPPAMQIDPDLILASK